MKLYKKQRKGLTLIEMTLILFGSLVVGSAGLHLINGQSKIQAQLHKLDVAERSLLCVDNALKSLSTDWNDTHVDTSVTSGEMFVTFTQSESNAKQDGSTNQVILYTADVDKGGTDFKQIRAQIQDQAGTSLMDVEITEPVYDSVTATIEGPLLTISCNDRWGGSTVSRMPISLE